MSSAKVQVLAVYPDAVMGYSRDSGMIFTGGTVIGLGSSCYKAWRDAASKLPASPVPISTSPQVEGATQTAEWISKVSEKADKYGDLARDARAEERWELSDYNDGVAFGLLLALRMMKDPSTLRDDNKEAKHGQRT